MALISKLENIANEIRNKTGKSDLLTLEQMASEIAAIEVGGGGGDLPEEAFKITGDCQYRFAGNGWNWFINTYGNKIKTENIKPGNHMFYQNTTLTEIPFDINCDGSTYGTYTSMFHACYALKKVGKIINMYPDNLQYMFNASGLQELPEFVNLNMSRIYEYNYSNISRMFSACNALRSIPEDFLKQLYTPLATSTSYTVFMGGFDSCYVLDELRGLNPQTGAITSNMFANTFGYDYRLKEIIFATQEDGTPYSVNWRNQTIELSKHSTYGNLIPIGVAEAAYYMTNNGIAADKQVKDDATYQALKNDPDWFTTDIAYSRYNHDSAVNTINSLPSTSNTGCTIKFLGAAGEKTDGGAINTLTEEEIAVAAAKGWTVTLV